MPKRLDDVAQPPKANEWSIRYGTSEAAANWPELCKQLPGTTREAWDRMRQHPLERTDTQKPLGGKLGSRIVAGRELPQWQTDLSSGGRIWYCFDEVGKTVWLMLASARHPGATQSKGKNTSRNR